ncbi:MAG: hypothetical protein LBL71_03115 [Endomicrobium sp.]|jgi:MtN3 and saliva related transmembrane protein|nr:hypothetical protein [Endomicrobium sp.]
MEQNLEYLGYIAGCLSIIAFIPQVYKTYKLKSAKDISIYMFIIYTISIIIWTIYGILSKRAALYITNLIMLAVSNTQIVLKIKYDRADKLAAQKQNGGK